MDIEEQEQKFDQSLDQLSHSTTRRTNTLVCHVTEWSPQLYLKTKLHSPCPPQRLLAVVSSVPLSFSITGGRQEVRSQRLRFIKTFFCLFLGGGGGGRHWCFFCCCFCRVELQRDRESGGDGGLCVAQDGCAGTVCAYLLSVKCPQKTCCQIAEAMDLSPTSFYFKIGNIFLESLTGNI